MEFVGGIYSLINDFMISLTQTVMGICGTLPIILTIIAVPVSVLALLAFGLVLMTWPVTIPVILYIILRDLTARVRLRKPTIKIAEKFISHANTNYPNINIAMISLYFDKIVLRTANSEQNFYAQKDCTIKFETDLNFDLSKLPKDDIFYKFLAKEIIQKYPLPNYKYVKRKSSGSTDKEFIGYNATQTNYNKYEKSVQVRVEPVFQTSHYVTTYHEIVPKKSAAQHPLKEQNSNREVL